MSTENIYKRVLKINYNTIVEGKDKKTSETYSNVKLTSTVDELYIAGTKLGSLINAPSVEIEKIDYFNLEE